MPGWLIIVIKLEWHGILRSIDLSAVVVMLLPETPWLLTLSSAGGPTVSSGSIVGPPTGSVTPSVVSDAGWSNYNGGDSSMVLG